MDVLVRDLLQVGQGLQIGRVVGIPNGGAATQIARPGPVATGGCAGVTPFPLEPTISAVTVGPDMGPPINGQCTDVITTLALDGAFERVTVDAIAADGQSITINAGVGHRRRPGRERRQRPRRRLPRDPARRGERSSPR